MTTIDNSTVCGKDNCSQSPAQCAADDTRTDMERLADLMEKTNVMTEKLKSEMIVAASNIAASLKEISGDVAKLPDSLQQAWLGFYTRKLEECNDAYGKSFE